MSQNTNKSCIFGHTGGNMSWRETARDKKLFFSCPHRSHALSKKRGHWYLHFWGKSIYNSKKTDRGSWFKITTLIYASFKQGVDRWLKKFVCFWVHKSLSETQWHQTFLFLKGVTRSTRTFVKLQIICITFSDPQQLSMSNEKFPTNYNFTSPTQGVKIAINYDIYFLCQELVPDKQSRTCALSKCV